MNDKECIIKLGKLANSMDVDVSDVINTIDKGEIYVVDSIFRRIKMHLNRSGEYDKYSPCCLGFHSANSTIDIKYHVDGINIVLSVTKEFEELKEYLSHISQLTAERDVNLKNPFWEP